MNLKPHQLDALRKLGANPDAWIPSAILGMLRKAGLVGKHVGRSASGNQKTTSPITASGLAMLRGIKDEAGQP